MTTCKNVILTAVNFKGINQAKAEAAQLADGLCCSVNYVLSVIRQVEKGQIIIK